MITERKTLALFGGILALLLGFFVVLYALRQTHEVHIADRFAVAVEMLGKDDLTSRLSGIYALGHLASVSEGVHVQMVEILTTYIRERAPAPAVPSAPAEPQIRKLTADIQACLTVLGRRSMDFRKKETQQLNLARTDLRGANLVAAYLESANLNGAWLQGANLSHAQLNRALLKGAHLEKAGLDEASLIEAYLGDTHLEGASLMGTNLRGAYLAGAHMEGAKLLATDLRGAFGLTWDQVKLAQRNQQARFPDYLRVAERPGPESQ